MFERRVTVASKVGLHARPAALVAKAAAAQPVKITIRKDDTKPVEAGSILGLMTLGAAFGDEVVLEAAGEGAEAALDHIAQLVATDLDNAN
ncbi:phosphocarrier protein [Saccharopolyspora antimicrobica]|uniref:Phosphocarrier protein HPr n=2 Tax=Saccharopolyspora TaxID=1835 RepID=A0A1I5BF91_9PSEU|nr:MULTISPECIES: HPr family phosphocarrier protein [Saccharopolyspora]RKT86585.1 phosphocarrier protein [Saccharopolyspora antimicrobica]SEG71235.1 phosphocarrier protein [Saccharopolyspora kobensis]SFC37239.1 phosphocarrier protein [Saccharopolyspora kobensis]SFN73171.1 phosphocarrier protein [Saccharopolyspora antimicrobica]